MKTEKQGGANSRTQTGWCLKILRSMTFRPNNSSQTVSTSTYNDEYKMISKSVINDVL